MMPSPAPYPAPAAALARSAAHVALSRTATRLFAQAEGDGEPVVCLHSSTGTHGQWKALAGLLKPHAQVILPDLHGHGRSPQWQARAGNILAADASSVMLLAGQAVAQGSGQGVHLVGHSYGAAVALRIALRHPRLVRSLTLYEPVAFGCIQRMAPGDDSFDEIRELAGTVSSLVYTGELAEAARTFFSYWAGPGAWDALPAEQQAAIAARIEAVPMHFAALFAANWGRAELSQLAVPTLLLHGEHTRAPTRCIVELLADNMPRARVRRIDGAGHLGPITHPQAVSRCMAGHLVAQMCLPSPAELLQPLAA